MPDKWKHPARRDDHQVAQMVGDAAADKQMQAKAGRFAWDVKPHRKPTDTRQS